MKAIDFTQADRDLGAGKNPNTVPLRIGIAADKQLSPGVVFIVSCWELSNEELEIIKNTGKIYLSIMANPLHATQPPVSLHAFDPYTPADQGGYTNPYTVVKDPFKFYLHYLIESSHIKEGDTIRGEWVTPTGERYSTEGVLIKKENEYFIERVIGDPDLIPFDSFIAIHSVSPRVTNPFTDDKIAWAKWGELTDRYEKIMLLEGPTDTVNEQLKAWHEEANVFISLRSDYEQRHKDFLTHS